MSIVKRITPIIIMLVFVIAACSPLQKARIRQEVTIDAHIEEHVELTSQNKIMVLSFAHEETTLSKTTLSANEATADIMSLKLLDSGFHVIDRAVINDYIKKEHIDSQNMDFSILLKMGRTFSSDYLILINLFEYFQDSHAIRFLPGNVLTSIDTSTNIGLSSRMIDLRTGEVIWVGVATTQDQNFQKAIQRVSEKMIASLKNHTNH